MKCNFFIDFMNSFFIIAISAVLWPLSDFIQSIQRFYAQIFQTNSVSKSSLGDSRSTVPEREQIIHA
jgi:hypothetical protein